MAAIKPQYNEFHTNVNCSPEAACLSYSAVNSVASPSTAAALDCRRMVYMSTNEIQCYTGPAAYQEEVSFPVALVNEN